MRAVLSIGSNMADSRALLRGVRDAFRGELIAASPVYATPPWGVTDQPDFLNAVLIVEVDATPLELLRRGQHLEQEAGRVRQRRWGPRTLDIDIVQVSDGDVELRSGDPVLTLPHPHAHERAFVLVPWLAADPDAVLAGEPLAAHLARIDAAELAQVRPAGTFDGGEG